MYVDPCAHALKGEGGVEAGGGVRTLISRRTASLRRGGGGLEGKHRHSVSQYSVKKDQGQQPLCIIIACLNGPGGEEGFKGHIGEARLTGISHPKSQYNNKDIDVAIKISFSFAWIKAHDGPQVVTLTLKALDG